MILEFSTRFFFQLINIPTDQRPHPLYIQEYSPIRLRVVWSYQTYTRSHEGWRRMAGLGVVPAAIRVVFLFVRDVSLFNIQFFSRRELNVISDRLVYLLEERTEEVDLEVKVRSNEASTSPTTPPSSNVSTCLSDGDS
ncbi:hypothetical protein E1B28_006731 [Marasmius oreades]|uniref:Uncharacterized protein n=1 Tax=Marasmius oreades TaxID=181124 RepID=A0A9P7UWS8_9AGAR|nr:uncharacterized protein E1B28_006731 [Marasmius oreades]KAG7096050.1 hypothetical protein E1B28_006731 [Marasmius oreades]